MVPLFLLSAFGLFSAGCVNLEPEPDRTQRFALGSVAAPAEPQEQSSRQPIRAYIARPSLPGYLDRSQMVYRAKSGKVEVLPYTRWAEPIHEGVARALAESLETHGNIIVAGRYPWPNRALDAAEISLQFERFDATAEGEVIVASSWLLKHPDGRRESGRFRSRALRWEPGDPGSLIATYNKALASLAEEIADAH